MAENSSPWAGRFRNLSMAAAGSELHRLCRSGDLSAVRSYLNEVLTETVVNKTAGLNGCTPLHEAAMSGRADVVRLLVEECEFLDMNVRTQRGPASTPLHLAAERGHVDTVIALIDCGASLTAVDRRCRTAKDIAAEHRHRQVVVAITAAEVESATGSGNVLKLTEALAQLEKQTRLCEEVRDWKQEKLDSSLEIACKLGNYRLAIPLIKAGAESFKQCIMNSPRMNHILAFLRLCQAAREDDMMSIQLLLSWNEEEVSTHPLYSSLMQYNNILMPLIENGTLSVAVPIRVAIKHKHPQAVATLLAKSVKHPDPTTINWHGLELEDIDPYWLKQYDYSTVTLICLSFNSLKQVPEEVLKFRNLTKLQISSSELAHIPTEIFYLDRIENIDLSCNVISSLPDALLNPISPSLRVLNLSNNLLTMFPDYFAQSKLTHLDLSSNRYQEIPTSLFKLRFLESLDLSHNTEIKHVPYELGGLKHLQALSLNNVHSSVNIPDKEKEGSLLKFLQDRYKSMQTVTHYELQVIGFPRHPRTLEGMMSILVNSDLKCSTLKFASPYQFLFLYEIFHLPNVIYLIPWDCHSKQDVNDLHLVLRHLSVYSPDSPVIVVACWKSILYAHSELDVENQISNSLWCDLGDRIRLHHVLLDGGESSVETGGETTVQMLVNAIDQASERVKLTSLVPCSYFNCDNLLKEESDKLQGENRSLFLSEWDFWELVRSMPSHDFRSHHELPELVKFLCSAGTIGFLPSPKESQPYYALSRQWYCQVLGNIISENSLLMARTTSAVVRQEGLVDLLGTSFVQIPIPTALQYVLNRYGVSLALSSEKWLVPAMLNKQPELTFSNFSCDDIKRQYTCTFIPITLMGRLINHLLINMEGLMRHLSQSSGSSQPRAVDWRYWRNGIVCWMNACDLVYSIEKIDINTEPFHQGIEIRVANTKFGHNVMHLLTFIIDSLLKNWYPTVWKSVEVWVPCSYCIHTRQEAIPSISFQDCLYALSKGVGVKCVQHLEKIVKIGKIVPDLVQEDVNAELFIPPESVRFNLSDKSTCLSPAPTETVFKGYYNSNLIAVKPFPSPVPNTSGKCTNVLKSTPVLELWTEFEVLRHLEGAKCPYILKMIGMCPEPLSLLFPFAKWSSLEEVIGVKDLSVPRVVRLRMLYQLATALEVLHSFHVIHRNISLSNILVYSLSPDDEVNIKLGGFSNACYGVFQGIGVGCYGTFPAPEMLNSETGEYDERVDIFAFGFVAYEIITRSTVHVRSSAPFKKTSSHITTSDRPSLNPVRNRAPYLCELLAKCWNPDPFKRPYASKIVECLRDPLNILVQDGDVINKNHEFYAAAAKFTRVKNSFHTDVFICSGELTGQSTAYLTHISVPDFEINRTIELPSEFVICMGCVGTQLWVSFFGKKVRVYASTGKLKYINEFTFSCHVVAIGVSPTSVYLGLENGVLQVYDVTENNIPTEPSLTKVVCQNEDFKTIEPLEDSVVCATNDAVYRLHPDSLEREAKISVDSRAGIRCIAIYEDSADKEREEGGTLWVSFRRTDQVQVLNSWTGNPLYAISCSTIVAMIPNKVWVYSLRIVLDTIWIGLNTGHILVFAVNATSPNLLTYLHVHTADVRQILLLHPPYMGHMSILSASEMLNISLNKAKSDTLRLGATSSTLPDSVLVLSMGIGLQKQFPSVKQTIEEDFKDTVESCGLYTTVLEGLSESRVQSIELVSSREPIPYMETYSEDHIYDFPPIDSPVVETRDSRRDTWTYPEVVESPVQSKFNSLKQASQDMYVPMVKVYNRDSEDDEPESPRVPPPLPPGRPDDGTEASQAPPLPPRPDDLQSDETSLPEPSPQKSFLGRLLSMGKKKPKYPTPSEKQTTLSPSRGTVAVSSSPPANKGALAPPTSGLAVPSSPSANKGPLAPPSLGFVIVPSLKKPLLPPTAPTNERTTPPLQPINGRTTPPTPPANERTTPPTPSPANTEEEEEYEYDYPYMQQDLLCRSQSLRPQHSSFPSSEQRRSTMDPKKSQRTFEDSEEYEPYVSMNQVLAAFREADTPRPKMAATKVVKKLKSKEVSEDDDLITREEFLGKKTLPPIPPKKPDLVRYYSTGDSSTGSPGPTKRPLLPKPAPPSKPLLPPKPDSTKTEPPPIEHPKPAPRGQGDQKVKPPPIDYPKPAPRRQEQTEHPSEQGEQNTELPPIERPKPIPRRLGEQTEIPPEQCEPMYSDVCVAGNGVRDSVIDEVSYVVVKRVT